MEIRYIYKYLLRTIFFRHLQESQIGFICVKKCNIVPIYITFL